jgi:hypothetical protein
MEDDRPIHGRGSRAKSLDDVKGRPHPRSETIEQLGDVVPSHAKAATS